MEQNLWWPATAERADLNEIDDWPQPRDGLGLIPAIASGETRA